MRSHILLVCALIGCVLIALIAWRIYLRRGILVVVHNSGSRAIFDVKAESGGGTISLGEIGAGRSGSDRLVPGADSDVAISFVDDTQKRQTIRLDIYVTGGLRGRIDAEINDGKLEHKSDNLAVALY